MQDSTAPVKETRSKKSQKKGGAGLTKKNIVLVSVSALALSAYPFRDAHGQAVNINCTQDFGFGQHIACGNGSLRIDPDGSTNIVGCLISLSAPSPARCLLTVSGPPPTRDVKVTFNTNTIVINDGGLTVTMKNFKMQEFGQPTTAAKLTFTPLELTTTIKIDVGGTLNFTDKQPQGNYSGNLTVNANFN